MNIYSDFKDHSENCASKEMNKECNCEVRTYFEDIRNLEQEIPSSGTDPYERVTDVDSASKDLWEYILKLLVHLKKQDARIRELEKDLEARETLEMERSEL